MQHQKIEDEGGISLEHGGGGLMVPSQPLEVEGTDLSVIYVSLV
jgi:hypothetical protein